MKYKEKDRVRIKSLDWYKEQDGLIPSWLYPCCGRVMTITVAYIQGYAMEEVQGVLFKDFMIEGLVEEDNIFDDTIPLPDSFVERIAHKNADSELFQKEPLDIPTMTTDFVKEHGLPCPNGYIFKDENGNVINATKIVLEKKKKEYPKTYEECIGKLSINWDSKVEGYKHNLLATLQKLLICRDTYWKIAGEEMGLGRPWKPKEGLMYSYMPNAPRCIRLMFPFPTQEMCDAFYENFKEEIEICKELL